MAFWKTKEQRKQLLIELIEHPSITGSKAEETLSKFIEKKMLQFPYFQQNPQYVKLHATEDERNFVTALVKKQDVKKTIILVSHFDVVDVKDYGPWEEVAFQPEKLTRLFKEQIAEMPDAVQKDVETGNWLFGRGTMDMKCGLAVQLSMLEQASNGEFDGNILLLTVPDEEVNSVGMRAAVPVLLEMAKQFDLEYTMVLNAEPMFTRYPGDDNKYIYTGSIGKILPGFYCYGKETHVGEPFSGLNANWMVSELIREIELNEEYCEVIDGEASPPPTNLLQKDLKEDYSVQIPHRAVTLFNVFILQKSIDEIFQKLHQSAEKAARQIENSFLQKSKQFSKWEQSTPKTIDVTIFTVDELKSYAIKTYGKEVVDHIWDSALSQKNNQDDRERTIQIIDQLSILCKELSPMIIMFFAPPYYPAVYSGDNVLIKHVVEETQRYAKEQYDFTLHKQNYFYGISDLSYVGLQHPISSFDPLVNNMPLWNKPYTLSLEALEAFQVPVLNIGPVGKDAHQWTERLDLDYAFGPFADLLQHAIRTAFEK